MMMLRTILLGLLVTAACSDGGSSTPDASAVDALPKQTVTEDKALLVGEIGEAILTGGPGDRAVITLTAPVAKLDWNIHGHANGQTQTVKEELGIMSSTYVFEPTAQAEWYLLIRNQHTMPMTVNVTIDLYGDFEWSGW
jgi:hypothetical protein